MSFVPLGSRLSPPPIPPLPRTPFVVTPAPMHTKRDLSALLPASIEELHNSKHEQLIAAIETESGENGLAPRPPRRVKFDVGSYPADFNSFYLSFRYADLTAPKTVSNCWGLMISRQDIYLVARAASEYGLPAHDAVDSAVSLLINLLEPRFLVDRAVQSLERLAAFGGKERHFWHRFAQVAGNDLETAICVAHARRASRGAFKSFQVALLKAMNTGMCAVDFRDGSINGEHHSVAESINLTNYLRGSYFLHEIPDLHRLLGLGDESGRIAKRTLEIARGENIPVPICYVP